MNFLAHAPWIVPAALLSLLAFRSFNQPPTNRSSTTFFLFYFGLFLYDTMLLVLWILVVAFTTLSSAPLTINIEGHQISLAPTLAFALLLVASHLAKAEHFNDIKWLGKIKNFDEIARKLCMSLAAIPRQADQLALQLTTTAGYDAPDEASKTAVQDFINTKLPGLMALPEDAQKTANRLRRAVSLFLIFLRPGLHGTVPGFATGQYGRSGYTKIFESNPRVVAQIESSFEGLMQDAHGMSANSGAKTRRHKERALRKQIAEFEIFLCGLIARYVLYQDKTAGRRQRRLTRIGFTTETPISSLGRDRWVASVMVTTAVTFGVMTLSPQLRPLAAGEAVLRAFMFALQIGFAIIGGATVARRFIQTAKSRESNFPPLAELTIAALIVLGLSAGMKIMIPLLPHIIFPSHLGAAFESVFREFVERSPGLVYPAFATVAIGLLCGYVGMSGSARLGQAAIGAAGLTAAFIGAGLLYLQLMDAAVISTIFSRPEAVLRGIIWNSVIIGSVVGAIIVVSFGDAVKAKDAEQALRRRASKEPGPESPSNVIGASRELGAYLKRNVEDLEGEYVCFRPKFGEPTVINAYLLTIQWDEKQSCLSFRESGRTDTWYTQSGPIYVPSGRPFFSLTTVDQGEVRLIMVCRPDVQGIARGLVLTLAHQSGPHFIPASSPIVLRRVTEAIPQIGFIRPHEPDYARYREELENVVPQFGLLVTMSEERDGRAKHARDLGIAQRSNEGV